MRERSHQGRWLWLAEKCCREQGLDHAGVEGQVLICLEISLARGCLRGSESAAVNEILANTIGTYAVTAYAAVLFVKTLGELGCL